MDVWLSERDSDRFRGLPKSVKDLCRLLLVRTRCPHVRLGHADCLAFPSAQRIPETFRSPEKSIPVAGCARDGAGRTAGRYSRHRCLLGLGSAVAAQPPKLE